MSIDSREADRLITLLSYHFPLGEVPQVGVNPAAAADARNRDRDHTVIRVPHRKRPSLTRKRTQRLVDRQLRRCGSQAFWFSKLPCLEWARGYSVDAFCGDLIAGLTTALTVIPQGIGYAPLAGLPLQVINVSSVDTGKLYPKKGKDWCHLAC